MKKITLKKCYCMFQVMSNMILLMSAILCATVHIRFITPIRDLHRFIIVLGLLSSILNHSTTNPVAQAIDRVMMIIGVFIDLCVFEGAERIYILSAVLYYVIAKASGYIVFHVISHLLATTAHHQYWM